jgi:hypothetical protein
MSNGDGPFLQTAVICEKVLQEQDGAVSAIRLIDRVFFIADPDGRPLNPQTPISFSDHVQVRQRSRAILDRGPAREALG